MVFLSSSSLFGLWIGERKPSSFRETVKVHERSKYSSEIAPLSRRSHTSALAFEWTSNKMTRRLLSSHLRRLLNPVSTPITKPFSSPSSQQNPLSQSHLFSWQFKPNRSLYFSTYNPSGSGRQLLAQSRNTLPMMRFLTRGARTLSFSLQRRSGLGQILSSVRRFWYVSLFSM